MSVSSINNVTSNSPAGTDAAAAVNSAQMLSQNDFLKLLVTQMTSQDPTKPMDSQDMLAQMTQFSTLQANTSLQTELGQMQTSQNLTQANSLLGRQVTVQVDANTTAQGVVSGIDTNSGTPLVIVNGTAYDLSQVLAISTPPTP
jgi:flagellar basal-body rod modification protein FlgD